MKNISTSPLHMGLFENNPTIHQTKTLDQGFLNFIQNGPRTKNWDHMDALWANFVQIKGEEQKRLLSDLHVK